MLDSIIAVYVKEIKNILRDRSLILAVIAPMFVFPLLAVGLSMLGNADSVTVAKESIIFSSELPDELISYAQERGYTLGGQNEELLHAEVVVRAAESGIDIVCNENSFAAVSIAMNLKDELNEVIGDWDSQFKVQVSNAFGGKVDIPATVASFAFPVILLILALHAPTSLSADFFAGERERGTLEMLLLSGNRSGIYFGKAACLISIACIETLLALIIAAASESLILHGDANWLLVGLFLLLLTISITLISACVSIYVKTVRATQLISTILIAIPTVGAVLAASGLIGANTVTYLIPLYGVSIAVCDAFSGGLDTNSIIAAVSTMALVGFMIYVSLVRIHSEKVFVRMQ